MKAAKFCEISTVDLTVTTQDKSTVEISQNFVAFSEYMNFRDRTKTKSPQQWGVAILWLFYRAWMSKICTKVFYSFAYHYAKKWNFLQDVTSVEISKMHQPNTGLKVHSRILFCKWLGHDMISIETFLRNYLIMYELQGDKAS